MSGLPSFHSNVLMQPHYLDPNQAFHHTGHDADAHIPQYGQSQPYYNAPNMHAQQPFVEHGMFNEIAHHNHTYSPIGQPPHGYDFRDALPTHESPTLCGFQDNRKTYAHPMVHTPVQNDNDVYRSATSHVSPFASPATNRFGTEFAPPRISHSFKTGSMPHVRTPTNTILGSRQSQGRSESNGWRFDQAGRISKGFRKSSSTRSSPGRSRTTPTWLPSATGMSFTPVMPVVNTSNISSHAMPFTTSKYTSPCTVPTAPFLPAVLTPANMAPSMELSTSGIQEHESAPANNVPLDHYDFKEAKSISCPQLIKKMFLNGVDDLDAIISAASGPGIDITPAHRSELKDSMCKRRGNHLKSIVDKFFYATNGTTDQYPSKKHPSYGFRQVRAKDFDKDPSTELLGKCRFNRENAAKFLKDCRFFRANGTLHPVMQEILKYFCSAEFLERNMLQDEVASLGMVPTYLVEYAFVLTWQALKKISNGYWDSDYEFTRELYFADAPDVKEIINHMLRDEKVVALLRRLYHQGQGLHIQRASLRELALELFKRMEDGQRPTEGASRNRRRRSSFP